MSGMNSRRLSERARQPGHDRSFEHSESVFIRVARQCLRGDEYMVEEQPRDLASIFPTPPGWRDLGVKPEAKIASRATGRMFFVEVKKQGDRGNAEERAMKHHTVQFYKTLKERFGYTYHPFVTIFCEALATNPRYTRKFPFLIEDGHYLLWKDYDAPALCDFLMDRCRDWLD